MLNLHYSKHVLKRKGTVVYISQLFNNFSTDATKVLSSRKLNLEMQRRIREKQFESMLEEDRQGTKVTDDVADKQDHVGPNFVESIVAARYFAKNLDRFSEGVYADVIDNVKRRVNDSKTRIEGKNQPQPKPMFPIQDSVKITQGIFKKSNAKNDIEQTSTDESSTEVVIEDRSQSALDRGFFVNTEGHKDEFISGSAAMLPQEPEFSISGNLDDHEYEEGDLMKFRHRVGSDDAVEEIEFQMPHQEACKKDSLFAESKLAEDWSIRYGNSDATVAPADKNCPACGAQFHCNNSGLPGFLPAEYFAERADESFADTLCRRCYLLKTHNFLLNVNVSPVNYEKMLSKLQLTQEALIILIVDLLDFPCSIYKSLPDLIGHGKHTIIVGNKVDLIPPDYGEGYLAHYTHCLRDAAFKAGLTEKLNVLKTFLISAKTGYNVEQLVGYILTAWQNKGDIYLVGCTNSGKSTLFNAFIQSDLCKVKAVDLVERATTSVWPGTTMSLLKFPVMNPSPFKLMMRRKRLANEKRHVQQEEKHRRHLLEQTGDPQYAVLQGYIGQTMEAQLEVDENQPIAKDILKMPEPKKSAYTLTHPDFLKGKWCYDTPGTINPDQIINILTLEELVKTIPNSLLVPRTVILHKYECLFIAGLARVDFFGPPSNLMLTVFASEELPLHVVNVKEAVSFYRKFFGSSVLVVPFGSERRLKEFPLLESEVFDVDGEGFERSCADIVLSSVGWVAVSAAMDKTSRIRAWTPRRRGLYLRPSLLPFAVNCKGRRIPSSNEYAVEPLLPIDTTKPRYKLFPFIE